MGTSIVLIIIMLLGIFLIYVSYTNGLFDIAAALLVTFVLMFPMIISLLMEK